MFDGRSDCELMAAESSSEDVVSWTGHRAEECRRGFYFGVLFRSVSSRKTTSSWTRLVNTSRFDILGWYWCYLLRPPTAGTCVSNI